jgi:hypothetical protein
MCPLKEDDFFKMRLEKLLPSRELIINKATTPIIFPRCMPQYGKIIDVVSNDVEHFFALWATTPKKCSALWAPTWKNCHNAEQ